MKAYKAFLPILLLILALALCLSGCGKTKAPATTTPSETTPTITTPPPGGDITVDGGYTIISGARSTTASSENVFEIYEVLRRMVGSTVTMKTDAVAASEKEIIVGDTSRAESAEARALIASLTESSDTGVWVLLAVGDKLIVAGNNPVATEMAVKHLLENYFTDARGAKFPSDLHVTDTYSISEREAELDRIEQERIEAERAAEIATLKEMLAALPSSFGEIPTITSPYETPSVRPTANEHPRVMVNRSMLSELKTELDSKNAAGAKILLLEYVARDPESYHYGVRPDVTDESSSKHNCDEGLLGVIEANAYYYLLTKDERYGYRAILGIQNYINTLEIWEGVRDTPGIISDTYRRYGYTMLIAGEVYDWCYDLLTQQDKDRIIGGICTKIAPKMEIKFPPSSQGAVTGHGSEAQILRDYFAFAIAVADEYPALYDYVMGRLESQYVPVRNYFYQSDMYMTQGNSYGTYRYQFDLTAQHLYRVMTGGKSLFEGDMRAVGRTFIYNLRPDNSLLRLGDDGGERSDTYSMSSYRTLMHWLAYVTGDPVALAEVVRIYGSIGAFNNGDQSISVAQFLCIYDDELEPASLDELPLAVYNGSPVGQIIAHSKWTGADAVLLYMKIGENYTANHEHKDVGQFQIYYKGILAGDAGFYEGYGGQLHDYTKSTLAHNSLLIYDPSENTGDRMNLGGQISRDDGESVSLSGWLGKWNTKRGTVLGHEIAYNADGTLDYTYLSGDITAAYAPEKADEVLRYMYGAFTGDENAPLVFFVFDKITASDPTFKKTFLLQCETEPVQSGNLSILRSARGGMLVNRTLSLGTSPVGITVVEGKYKLPDGSTAQSNRPSANHDSKSLEAGWGRIEISPALGNRTDYLLNVMYVANDNTKEAAPTYAEAKLYENREVAGASIFGYAVFFSKTADRLSSRFEICGEGEGEISYSVTGVTAGEWSIYDASGNLLSKVTATEEGGMLHFKAPAGSYTLIAPGESVTDIPGDGVFPDPYSVSK